MYQKNKEGYPVNRNIAQSFATILHAIMERNTLINGALAMFRQKTAAYDEQYKPDVAAEMKERAIQDARSQILAADTSAQIRVSTELAKLREQALAWESTSPDGDLLNKVRLYYEMRVRLSKNQLMELSVQSKNNLVVLSCIAKLAENSGFAMTYSTAADFEKDLQKIEHAVSVPSLYAGHEYFTEGNICCPDIEEHKHSVRRPMFVELVIAQKLGESIVNDVQSMEEKWSYGIIPTFDEIAGIKVPVAEVNAEIEMPRSHELDNYLEDDIASEKAGKKIRDKYLK